MRKIITTILIGIAMLGNYGGLFFLPPVVLAASLTSLSDTMSTVKINTPANHDISFTTPSGVASGQTIILTFPSDYSISSSLSYTDINIFDNGTGLPLAASPTGSTWGVVRTSGTVITFTNGTTAVTAGHTIRIKIGTNATSPTGVYQITNPTTAGTYALAISGNFGDTGNISNTIVNNDTVAVTATVSQTLSFSISSNSITFGTLSTSAPRYADTVSGSNSDTAAHTLAVATNGSSGYAITVKGDTLTSGLNTIAAVGSTPAASAPGTAQFGIYATASGGSGATIATPYADSTTPSFGYDATANTATTFASGSGATTTTTYSLHYLANIAPTTPAGSYATSLTYVATANF